MKRPRIEAVDDANPQVSLEEMALNLILSSNKATIVVSFPVGRAPYVRLANEKARELLPQLWNPTESSAVAGIWNSIMQVVLEGDERQEEVVVPGLLLKMKYRTTHVDGEPVVIVNAKKIKQLSIGVMSQPREIIPIVTAIENDVVGTVLGLRQINMSVIHFPQRGAIRYLAGNLNLARLFKLSCAADLQDRTSVELGQTSNDSAIVYDWYHQHVENKVVVCSTELEQFPGMVFMITAREVIPGYWVCMAITHSRNLTTGPHPLSSPKSGVPKMWIRNRWDQFMEETLRYVNQNRQFTSEFRRKIPKEFFDNPLNVYCYAYMSDQPFLPSGNRDGYLWKSSRGIVSAGKLQRKYHYTILPNGTKLRRRVMWLEETKNLWIIEYRHFDNSCNTEADKLMGPDCMNWNLILNSVYAEAPQELSTSIDKISSHFSMAETLMDQSQLGPDNVLSYVSGILHHWASGYGH
ncbi:hypothetical protein PROFUN_10706 [Planoprotostelium fungivorum]|uniref:Uncharacterized protein n=1 Tax=Planoprotostelium fungivorum TaxID=1890364 RepID=A0A2P6N9M4_9EUKA|nr:hypothetical protein PROFUN_10706 [Planoprotostelium fungivorum]